MDLNDNGNRIIAGIIVVLLIIGAWYAGTKSKVGSTIASTTAGSVVDTSTSTAASASGAASLANTGAELNVSGGLITVNDQGAGSIVTVASVTLPKLGWVAIRDNTGRTLGAALFPAGTHANVQVPLLRATEPGQRYQALIYTDDGDKQFDLHKDTLLTNADGTVAGTTFGTN